VAVSVSEDHTVAVWDLATGARRAVFNGHKASVDRVAVSPDGRWAATASRDNDVLLWDLPELRLSRELYRTRQIVYPLRHLPLLGSSYLVCGQNDTGVGHPEPPRAMAFDRAGRLYTAGQEVICWDPALGAELFRFPWHGTRAAALAVHPAGFVAVVTPYALRICDAAGVPLATRLPTRDPAGEGFADVAFASDGALVTVHEHGTVRAWPMSTPAERGDERHPGSVSGVTIDPSGTSGWRCCGGCRRRGNGGRVTGSAVPSMRTVSQELWA
jgi:WD40 repeat protein